MKIYISTDLEGATGVFKFAQTREKGAPEFRDAMRYLMHDIAAVAEGLIEAGADEVLALDGHDGGNNFPPDHMKPGVRYITGWPRGDALWGLDESCDGLILLAAHAMNGTADGVLHHTQSSKAEAKYWYDDVEHGEIYQQAVIAGHFDVPVIMVTGDEAACREARALLGEDLPTVAVKKGISREAAVLIPFEETYEMLKEGGRRAVEEMPKRKPYKVKLPIQLRTRRLGPNPDSLDNPHFIERTAEVKSALDIISGSADR